jgi:hypothetical protein
MTYVRGPYSSLTSLPVPPLPEVHSARKYNYETNLLEIDEATGGFKGMPPTVQRVALLISFEVEDVKFITPQQNELVRKRMERALLPLTSGRAPLIKIERISVGSDKAGTTFREVRFQDLTINDPNVVQTVRIT